MENGFPSRSWPDRDPRRQHSSTAAGCRALPFSDRVDHGGTASRNERELQAELSGGRSTWPSAARMARRRGFRELAVVIDSSTVGVLHAPLRAKDSSGRTGDDRHADPRTLNSRRRRSRRSVMRRDDAGRQRIRTTARPRRRRDEIYDFIRKQRTGAAGYIVYPLVEEYEKVDSRLPPRWPPLSRTCYAVVTWALLHGRMSRPPRTA